MTDENEIWVGVQCREMILLELDYVFGTYLYQPNRRFLNEEQVMLFRRLPQRWLKDAEKYMPLMDECLVMFETLAMLSPELIWLDYDHASDRLRSLTADDLRAQVRQLDASYDAEGASIHELIMVLVELQIAPYQSLFQEYAQLGRRYQRTAMKLEELIGQPRLNRAFWAWVDRFMYDHYLPWRDTQRELLAAPLQILDGMKNRDGRYALGSLLAWLPKTNALHYRARLREYVVNGTCDLVLWQEPFGLFDSWSIINNTVILSVAEPGQLFSYAKDEILEIAEKASALSDPTRLGILRIIRHFDMDISEMAEYFGLSQPTVSIHVKKLREAGLITSFNDGHSLRHKLNADKLQMLFMELESFLDLGHEGDQDRREIIE